VGLGVPLRELLADLRLRFSRRHRGWRFRLRTTGPGRLPTRRPSSHSTRSTRTDGCRTIASTSRLCFGAIVVGLSISGTGLEISCRQESAGERCSASATLSAAVSAIYASVAAWPCGQRPLGFWAMGQDRICIPEPNSEARRLQMRHGSCT
jgi:hypothetical protein